MSSLLLAIVGAGKADSLMQLAKESGSSGGTILRGRGTASSSLLCLLGLGDSDKEVLLTLVDDGVEPTVWNALSNFPHTRGLLAAVPASRDEDHPIVKSNTWDLVYIICASGFADDIMAAARKAGAKGGTIFEGRGTATADDIAFFSASLVPEKEMLMILLHHTERDSVLEAVSKLPFLQERGSGIAFSVPVQKVAALR
ncbi:P-II family nitrogen regulator [Sphaerochaeta sp.]|uniref:P-II family nitrogen regulator n=1 Tax=Sphaerochaeta sp. TaxID=1972642 RepID=UPI003D1069FC